jgi:hypothetical protein
MIRFGVDLVFDFLGEYNFACIHNAHEESSVARKQHVGPMQKLVPHLVLIVMLPLEAEARKKLSAPLRSLQSNLASCWSGIDIHQPRQQNRRSISLPAFAPRHNTKYKGSMRSGQVIRYSPASYDQSVHLSHQVDDLLTSDYFAEILKVSKWNGHPLVLRVYRLQSRKVGLLSISYQALSDFRSHFFKNCGGRAPASEGYE